MVVAVFGDAHGHAEALDAVIGAAEACDAQELWSLGDMIGRGPDPEHVVTRTRERCAVALMGNHDYGATGSAEPTRFGEPGSPAVRSIELARDRLSGPHVEWMRSRKPAARRGEVQLWHGGPRNAVHEYVGASNAAACLAVQRAELGLVGHTHVAAAWRQTPRGAEAVKIRVGVSLDLAGGKWLLNPGAVGAPAPSRRGWWNALDLQAADGAYWLLLDLERRTATWRRAPYDPAPARLRARVLGLDDLTPRFQPTRSVDQKEFLPLRANSALDEPAHRDGGSPPFIYRGVSDAFSKYATFSGRSSRSAYWWFYLFGILVGIAAFLIDLALGTSGIIYGISGLALLLPSLAVFFRRPEPGRRTCGQGLRVRPASAQASALQSW